MEIKINEVVALINRIKLTPQMAEKAADVFGDDGLMGYQMAQDDLDKIKADLKAEIVKGRRTS
jgi:hypothetical protein